MELDRALQWLNMVIYTVPDFVSYFFGTGIGKVNVVIHLQASRVNSSAPWVITTVTYNVLVQFHGFVFEIWVPYVSSGQSVYQNHRVHISTLDIKHELVE